MCDTFRPLRLTTLARELDDPSYALSWHTPLRDGGGLSLFGWGAVRHGGGEPAPAARVGDEVVLLGDVVPDLSALIERGSSAGARCASAPTRRGGAAMPLADCEPLLPVASPTTSTSTPRSSTRRTSGACSAPTRRSSRTGATCRSATTAARRASSWRHAGAPPARPAGRGPLRADRALDVECELGLGHRCASARIFGFVLLNDWSARDVQAWEYLPLGPVPRQVVRDVDLGLDRAVGCAAARRRRARRTRAARVPARAREAMALDLELEVAINGEVVSRTNAARLYWTPRRCSPT